MVGSTELTVMWRARLFPSSSTLTTIRPKTKVDQDHLSLRLLPVGGEDLPIP